MSDLVKVTQVALHGLASNSNPNALPAGSCAVLNNATIRRPGMVTPMQADVTLETVTASSLTVVKSLYDEQNQSVAVILATSTDPVVWDQNPVGETMTGQIYTPATPVHTAAFYPTVPIKVDGTTRNLGFIPGMTQNTFSHFRSLTTEKWAVVADRARIAGLPPPLSPFAFVSSSAAGLPQNWLEAQASVAYRVVFSFESTDEAKQFIVTGPPSAVSACKNIDATLPVRTTVDIQLPAAEPVLPGGTLDLYVSIYRSSQAVVSFPNDLAFDFRRVFKKRLSSADFTVPYFIWEDTVSEVARNAGETLYTNAGEQGEGASHWAPPVSRDICVFKDTVFYANRSSLPSLTLTVPGRLGQLLSTNDRLTGIGRRTFLTGSTAVGTDVLTVTDSSELLGYARGQIVNLFTGAGFVQYFGGNQIDATSIHYGHVSTVTEAVTGSFDDIANVRVFYADGTSASFTGPILDFDNSGFFLNGAVTTPVQPIPGFRMLHGAIDPNRAVEGQSLIFTETWQGLKKMNYFDIFCTNSANYYPAPTEAGVFPRFKSIVDNRPNRVFFSANGEPEAVPLLSYLDIGSGTVLKMWSNQSAIFALCTDGLWRITGDSGTGPAGNYSAYQIDPTVFLVHPDCVCSLNNQIYAWVTDGIATLTENGALTISTDAIGPAIRAYQTQAVGWGAPYVWGPAMTGDSYWNEVWLNVQKAPGPGSDRVFETSYVFNDDTKNFTTQTFSEYTSLVYSPRQSRVIYTLPAVSTTFKIVAHTDIDPTAPQAYNPMLLWLNPVQTDQKGCLKQWVDLNLFVANFVFYADGSSGLNKLQAYFSAYADQVDPNAVFANNVNSATLVSKPRDLHFWVPRRTALSDQQQFGIATTVGSEGLHGYYIEIQGFTTRYRVASDTLKR